MDETRPVPRAGTSSIEELRPLPNESFEEWKARLLKIAKREANEK